MKRPTTSISFVSKCVGSYRHHALVPAMLKVDAVRTCRGLAN